jgi:hypothetical protein
MVIFNLNPRRRTVDGVRVDDLTVIESATKKKKDKPARLFETFD